MALSSSERFHDLDELFKVSARVLDWNFAE